MADTFPALLADLLRADSARPLVTFYDDASGERVELSVATYANWVAKTSSLLVEEFDLERGDNILVDLPTHWLGPVFLGAAWNVGLVVTFPGSEPDRGPDGVSAVVCGPDSLPDHADRAANLPVLACALLPLGVRFAEQLPEGVHDFGVEVWSQPDSFLPFDPPEPSSVAVSPDTSHAQVTAPGADDLSLGQGGRLLTTANPASPGGLASFVAPLVNRGSTVWVRHADPTRWEARYSEERATAQLGQPARS